MSHGSSEQGDSERRVSVEALGALCELRPRELDSSPGVDVREFADLNDGRRVFWKEDRGWSGSARFSPWPVYSGRDLAYEAIMVTDTDDRRLNSYVEWAIESLGDLGLDVDPASVYCAPFRVECGLRLEEEMGRVAQLFDPSARLRNRVLRSDPTAYRGEDEAALVDVDNDQARFSAWRAPVRASDSGDSVDVEENQARLQLEMPRALIERLTHFCHDQQATTSAIVRRLVEEHLDDCRY